MIEIRHLRHIISLANHRNFHRAADAVGITQPALSHSIRQAETHYGIPLFTRKRGEVKPTPFGLIVLDGAKAVLKSLDEAQRQVLLMKGLESGLLVIGCDPLLSEPVLAPALRAMLGRHERIRFQVTLGFREELRARLLEGTIDLYLGAPAASDPECDLIVFSMPPTMAFCRPGHPLFGGRSAPLGRAVGYPIIGVDPPWYVNWLARELGLEPGDARLAETVFARCGDYGLIRRLVKESDAISTAYRPVIEADLAAGTLVPLSIAGRDYRFRFALASRKGRPPSPAQEATVAAIREALIPWEAESRNYRDDPVTWTVGDMGALLRTIG